MLYSYYSPEVIVADIWPKKIEGHSMSSRYEMSSTPIIITKIFLHTQLTTVESWNLAVLLLKE